MYTCMYFLQLCMFVCVTLTPYIKGQPGTLYCIKAQLAGIYLSARPLTRENYDRCTLLGKPSLLLGNGDTNYPNRVGMGDKTLALRRYVPLGLVLYPPYLLGMMYVIHTSFRLIDIISGVDCVQMLALGDFYIPHTSSNSSNTSS